MPMNMPVPASDPGFVKRWGEDGPVKEYHYKPDQIELAVQYYLLTREAALARIPVAWLAFMEAMNLKAHDAGGDASYRTWCIDQDLKDRMNVLEKGQELFRDCTLHWSPMWLTWVDAQRVYDQIKDEIGDSEVVPHADSGKDYGGRWFCRWWWLGPKEIAGAVEERGEVGKSGGEKKARRKRARSKKEESGLPAPIVILPHRTGVDRSELLWAGN